MADFDEETYQILRDNMQRGELGRTWAELIPPGEWLLSTGDWSLTGHVVLPVLEQLRVQHVKDFSNNPFADIVEWLESEEGETWSSGQNHKVNNPIHYQEKHNPTVLGLFNLKDGLECIFCTSDLTTPGPSTHPERSYTHAWGGSTDQDGPYYFAGEFWKRSGELSR